MSVLAMVTPTLAGPRFHGGTNAIRDSQLQQQRLLNSGRWAEHDTF